MLSIQDPGPIVYTRDRLCADLRRLGLDAGDTVFVHSSYKSLGQVEGGVQTAIDALEDAIRPAGLLLMPSFNLLPPFQRRHETWDPATTPSSVGWITEFFRTLPDTVRSDHYSHSVAARGTGAQVFVGDHRSQEGIQSPWDRPPWGKTYGIHSPMARACSVGGKLLMLGVTYTTSTYVHFVESLYWDMLRSRDPDAPFPRLDRERIGEFWDGLGELHRGRVLKMRPDGS
jgi:aminoglycoside 3-N-acetyltransferase